MKFKKIIAFAIFWIIFLLSFTLALFSYDFIELPFSNPYKVAGIIAEKEYNPLNDVLRFLYIMCLPTLVLSLLYLIPWFRKKILLIDKKLNVGAGPRACPSDINTGRGQAQGPAPTLKRRVNNIGLFFCLGLVFILLIGGIFSSSNTQPLDILHEGQALGGATSLRHGKIPYKEAIPVHGVYESMHRPLLAFNLFGRSIASLRFFNQIYFTVAFILFFITLFYLFRKNLWLSLIAFFGLLIFQIVEIRNISFALLARDSVVCLFLIIVAVISEWIREDRFKDFKNKGNHLTLFMFSFLPIFAFAHSLDKGFFLSATAFLGGSALYFLYLKKRQVFYCVPLLSGALFGVLALGLIYQGGFYDFFVYAFLTMPKYKEQMDGLVYHFRLVDHIFPVLCFAALCYWLAGRLCIVLKNSNETLSKKLSQFLQKNFVECILLILATAHFRYALGRSDLTHIYNASTWIYFMLAFVGTKYYIQPAIEKIKWKPALACFSLLILLTYLCLWNNTIQSGTLYSSTYAIQDEELLPPKYKRAISFLKNNLRKDESFLTLTSEPAWYYLIDKPCPSRFICFVIASPDFYQREVIEDLKTKNIKYILYKSSSTASSIDQIGPDDRFPIIVAYLKKHYRPAVIIEGNEFWVRKSIRKDN